MSYNDYDDYGFEVGRFPSLKDMRMPNRQITPANFAKPGFPSAGPDMQGMSRFSVPQGLVIPGTSTPMSAFRSAGVNNRIAQGFPVVQWTNASTALTEIVKARPQQSLRPERLVVGVAKSAGAVGLSVVIDSIKVGKEEQLPSSDPIAVEAFTSDAVGTALLLDAASYGYEIAIQYTISAIPAAPGDTVTVSTALFCEAVDQ